MEERLERRMLKTMLRRWVEERLQDTVGEKGQLIKGTGIPSHEARSLMLELLTEVVEDLRKAEQEKAS